MVGMENRQKDKLIAVAFRICHDSQAHQRREILKRLWTPDHAMNIHFGRQQRVARACNSKTEQQPPPSSFAIDAAALPLNKYKSNSVICKWKSHVGKTRLVIYWLHVLRVLGINTIICIFFFFCLPFNSFSIYFFSILFLSPFHAHHWIQLPNTHATGCFVVFCIKVERKNEAVATAAKCVSHRWKSREKSVIEIWI